MCVLRPYAVLLSIPSLASIGCDMAAMSVWWYLPKTSFSSRGRCNGLRAPQIHRQMETLVPPPPPTPPPRSILPGRAVHFAPGNICAASRRNCKISYMGQLLDRAFSKGLFIVLLDSLFWQTDVHSTPMYSNTGNTLPPPVVTLSLN